MSKISLKPNANGVGTFTIEAPNSDISKTLVLPDSSGTIVNEQEMKNLLNVSGDAPMYTCRAWVNFDGTITPPTIRASGNVSSVVRYGVGDYTVNFATAMPDANYSVAGSTESGGASIAVQTTIYTSSSVRVQCRTGDTNTTIDRNTVSVAIFR